MFRMNTRESVLKIALACCWLLILVAGSCAESTEKTAEKTAEKTIYDYSLVGFDGKEVPLSTFKGKVLVIVNLASQSTLKNQLGSLETLQKTYKDKGLVVLGLPSNDFGALEPGTDAEIQKIYNNDLHVDFPLFSRVSVRGKDQSPLYKFLTSDKKNKTGGDVHWSYTKFIVDRAGKVVARFEPDVAPDSPELQATVEDVVAGTFKPPDQKDKTETAKARDGEDDDDSER
jgi:glutathione peroxidase